MKKSLSLRQVTWLVFILTEIAAILISLFLPLTDQEAYYWSWSKFPAISYFDHPPLQAWVTAVLTALFGDHAGVVRLPATGGRCAALYLLYLIGKKIYDERVALLTVLFVMGSFLLIFGSVIALPDVIATPLCLLAIYWTEEKRPKSAAMAVGLAVLAKWTSLFITPILLYRFWKQGLSKVKLLGQIILIPILIQAPVILWNIQNDFRTLKFHLVERQAHVPWPLMKYFHYFWIYVQSQIFSMGFTGITLLVATLLSVWGSSSISNGDFKHKSWRTLLWTLPGFLIVGISGTRGEVRFYWTNISVILLEMVLVAFVLEKKESWLKSLRSWSVGLTGPSWGLILLAVLIPFGAIVNKVAGKVVYSHPSLKSDLIQWSSWAEHSLSLQDRNDPELAFIASDIHIASQIAWILGKESILRVQVAGPHQNQFGVWQRHFQKKYSHAFFLADFRFENKTVFDGMCAEPLQWHTDAVMDDGYRVGELYWARCDQLRN